MAKITIDVGFLDKNVKDFKKDVNLLFTNIKKNIKRAKNHEPVIQNIQEGMRTNSMGFQNHPSYKETKDKLKSLGYITNSNPLNLTGQLVKDLYWKAKMDVSPDEWSNYISFRDDLILRPTMGDLRAILHKGSGVKVNGKVISSAQIVEILQTRAKARFPIIENIVKLYQSKIARSVEKAIDKAFREMK
jgi:hypothetical protein